MMGLYRGISTKKMKDGSNAIMVRFKHQGITYPIKNFTKLFGITNEKEASDYLGKIKIDISEGKDPFVKSLLTLGEIFDHRKELFTKNKTWGYWSIRNNTYYFNKHIRPKLGKLRIEKIKYEQIKEIYDSFEKDQHGSKNSLLDILKPIFREEFNKGVLKENIMDRFVKKRYACQKEPLSVRSKTKLEDIVRNLYNSIPYYNKELARPKNVEQHKMFLYMVLMTAHRTGELIQLEKSHCHIEEKMIIAPKEITKTNKDYHYPIPDECLEYIKNHKGGKLFNIPKGGTTDRLFRRLVNLAEIDTISHYNISAHDTRKLMLSIMVGHLGIDSRLADYCLDHSQKGVIKHYLEFTYEDKVKAYQKYWNFIREVVDDENEEIQEESNNTEPNTPNGSNFDKLKELVDMYKDGHINKDIFEYERDRLYQ